MDSVVGRLHTAEKRKVMKVGLGQKNIPKLKHREKRVERYIIQ